MKSGELPFCKAAGFVVPLICLVAFSGCGRVGKDWQRAKRANTVAAYSGFIKRHPEAAQARQARLQIEELDWKQATATDTRESYSQFMAKHPNSAQANDAEARIARFDWNHAMAVHTVASLETFITAHPKASQIRQARQTLKSVEWRQTREQNTISAYSTYIKMHPKSRHLADARFAIKALRAMAGVANPGQARIEGIINNNYIQFVERISVNDGRGVIEGQPVTYSYSISVPPGTDGNIVYMDRTRDGAKIYAGRQGRLLVSGVVVSRNRQGVTTRTRLTGILLRDDCNLYTGWLYSSHSPFDPTKAKSLMATLKRPLRTADPGTIKKLPNPVWMFRIHPDGSLTLEP